MRGTGASGDLRLHRIGDGVYLYRGFFSNSAVFVLPRAVLVVDTQVSPLAAARLRAEIRKISDLPVSHVVNTHYHGDHTGGNALFPEAEIVATEETAKFVVERDAERVEYARTFGLEFVEVHPTTPPTRTFRGRIEIEVGGERIEVLQLGRVETPDACVVWWPRRRALACGDGVATHDYPFLGVPFLDEGLRDDDSWRDFLRKIRDLRPETLLPGHGPALTGEASIRRRLDLLRLLFKDLIAATKAGLAAGTPVPDLIEALATDLAHWTRRPDLQERTVSQRFAIYRCINNLLPERAGLGWWHDLRPSVLPAGEAAALAAQLELTPRDPEALGRLADRLFDGARRIRPAVDATECIATSILAAKAALEVDPEEPLATLNLGAAEVFGGMVLAQPMERAIRKLESSIARGRLNAGQHRKAAFFLGKAHQMEQRDADADRWFKRVLPAWMRFGYPLIRERLRSFP